jgi:hypothetical protein
VDNFDFGEMAREMINANARSRIRPAGPSSFTSPSCWTIAHTAATWPCGTDRRMLTPAPAGTRCSPANERRNASTACAGSDDRLATVSLTTFPPSRNDRRRSVVT